MRQMRWIELLKDYDCIIQYHPGKANVVVDALSRKSIGFLAAIRDDGILRFRTRLCVPNNEDLRRELLEEAHCSRLAIHPGETKMYKDLRKWLNRLRNRSIGCAHPVEDRLREAKNFLSLPVTFSSRSRFQASIVMVPFEALYGRRCQSPICWDDIGEKKLLGPELVQLTVEKFEVSDHVFLKVSPMKSIMRFGRKGKLSPRFVGPFELEPIQISEDLTYEEVPVQIVDVMDKRIPENVRLESDFKVKSRFSRIIFLPSFQGLLLRYLAIGNFRLQDNYLGQVTFQFSGGGQLGLDGLCLGYPSFDHSRIMDKHRICYSWNRLPSAVRYGKPRAGLEPAKNSSNLTKIFP
ncbi:hypothetical protein CK203_095564 [Vitis vinifera]|uniref:Integrase zinc-binding domain-containing protein n=1 Tax=Vitis vinifera TaxID=29760 RepID=A0A438DC01_VITVI|nr:hypothetical protein CK203_095564 [Vitis vinifera]